MKTSNVMFQDMKEEEQLSWYVFPKKKLHPRSIDYERAFVNTGIWKVLRYLFIITFTNDVQDVPKTDRLFTGYVTSYIFTTRPCKVQRRGPVFAV